MPVKENKQQPSKYNHQAIDASADVIDLGALFFVFFERKLLIVSIIVIFALVGIAVVRFTAPIYNATAMIQIEDSDASLSGLDNISGMFESTSKSVTEIELLKSRSVIGEVVDTLQLDIVATPKLFPYIGERSFRLFNPTENVDIAEPSFGALSYAWGGEKIEVSSFDVPQNAINKAYILQVNDNQRFTLLGAQSEVILQGHVGEKLTSGGVTLIIKTLRARAGTEFYLSRKSRLSTILKLQASIGANEKGNDSGIINLNFQHPNPGYSKKVLNAITQIYASRNVERHSLEAQKSLEFLNKQLPVIKKELDASEARFTQYKISQKSVNISLETSGILTELLELETQLQELELVRLTMSRKFKDDHPNYKALIEQIEVIQKQRDTLAQRIEVLPETQQKLFRLTRDVEVGNEIYTMLLGKTQELEIARAGIIGNVRIIDVAEVNTFSPIKSNKGLIVVIATLLGAMMAVGLVLIQKAFSKGVKNPSEIEALGIPVFASVPYSNNQDKINDVIASRKTNVQINLAAIINPADLTIEALRSLRTSLHFSMTLAEDNLVVLSGPSPAVGKSFISANLGAVLAGSGKKVLLIDGDMRRGTLHKLLGLNPEKGLSECLSEQITIEQAIKVTSVADLEFISRGKVPPNPSELLMHKTFNQLMDTVKAKYDIVIIDTPPILAVTDGSIIANAGGITLLVVRYGKNSIKEIGYAIERFEQNGVNIQGLVFNGVLKEAQNANGYYGYYNYEYKSEKE